MTAHASNALFIHLSGHVKDNRPLLTGDQETLVHNLIKERCEKLKGVRLHTVNRVADHVHLAIEYEPYVTVSKLVGDIKGGVSFEANKRLGQKLVYWQRDYGADSFGLLNLPWVLRYIERQQEHHASGTTQERLERTSDEMPEGEEEAS